MGFSLSNIGSLVGGMMFGPTGAAIGGAAGSMFDGGSGGGAAAGGGGSGRGSAAQAFLDRSETDSEQGKQSIQNARDRNMSAAERAAAILNGYLEEKPREQRQETQERLRNFSLYR